MSYIEDKVAQEIYGKPAQLRDVPSIDERYSIPSTGYVGDVYMDVPLNENVYGGWTAYPSNTRASFYSRDNQGYPVFDDLIGGVRWGREWRDKFGYGQPLPSYNLRKSTMDEEYQKRLAQERAMQEYLDYNGAY